MTSTPDSTAAPDDRPVAGPTTHGDVSSTAESGLFVAVSRDRLAATVWVDPVLAPDGVTSDDILKRLKAEGYRSIDHNKVTSLADADGRVRLHRPMVISSGSAPIDWQPERLEVIAAKPPSDNGPADQASPDTRPTSPQADRAQPIHVSKGDVLAQVVAAVPGRDGLDVFGKAVRCRKLTPTWRLGPHVTLRQTPAAGAADQTAGVVIATAEGRLSFEDGLLAVFPMRHIDHTVGFSTGNVDFDGDVRIDGGVEDGFEVKAGADLFIAGAVGKAELQSGGSITINGDIDGKGDAAIHAAKSVSAWSLRDTRIRCGANLTLTGSLTGGRAVVGGAASIGGVVSGVHMTVTGGLTCGELGSPTFTRTLIEIGIDESMRAVAKAKLPEIEAKLNHARQVHSTVSSLLQRDRALTRAQKERATELLYESAETQEDMNRLMNALRKAYSAVLARSSTQLIIEAHLHPGVILRFPGMETTIQATFRGPVRISPDRSAGGTRIVLTDLNTKAATVIAARAVADPMLAALNKAMTAVDEAAQQAAA